MKTTLIKWITVASVALTSIGIAHASENQEVTQRVLVVMTNHSDYPTRDDSTGLWLTELTHFYEVFQQAGIEMDFVSPKGGEVPLDERSLGWMYSDEAAHALLQTPDFAARLNHTKAAADIDPANYSVIFYTGGHGTMWDFKDNKELKRIAEGIYKQGGIVSSVCHGAAGLLGLEDEAGKPLIANKKVTGFSNFEELLSGVKSQVPFYLQSEMEADGANYTKALLPFTSYVVTDGRLVTGQNPNSSREVALAVLAAMKNAE